MPFTSLQADVTSSGNKAPFKVSADLLGGRFSLNGQLNLKSKPHPYEGELRMDSLSFKRFAQVYSPEQSSEGDLTGHFNFTGKLDDWKALKGSGVLIILNGNLYAIPILGPLTPLLSTILPNPIRGYNVAKEANCTFRVADGFIVTKDAEALTSTFRIVSNGSIDFIHDEIDFDAQVRVRGLPGLVLRPVSQLLQYKAQGTMAKPAWKPHLFGLTDSQTRRRRPTDAELEAAAALSKPAAASDEAPPTPPDSKPSGPSILKFFKGR
jgi:hypothetical protein